MNDTAQLLPDVADPVLAPHWEAAGRGEVAIRRCLACGELQWPPRPNCLVCHAFDFEWETVEPRGTLFSYFVAHKPLHPAFADEVPYAAGVVELDSGIKMLGRLVEVDLGAIRIGMPVTARFVERAPGTTLVYWGPAD
jgi:uncharacterized OB-fold protein